jgi:hypothetical protein
MLDIYTNGINFQIGVPAIYTNEINAPTGMLAPSAQRIVGRL